MSRQGRSAILSLLGRHGVRPRRSWGQHFLADPNLVAKVVELAGIRAGDRVVEVGPGTGTLTLALVDAGAEVVAYEVDRRLAPVLDEVLAGRPVDLRFADITQVDLAGDLGPERGWKLVANLPYNVGTPLVLDILRRVPEVEVLVVMVQREVAERLVALPGTAAYGLPSVVVGLLAEVGPSFRVPPQVFVPAPTVDSSVVRLDRLTAPAGADSAIELAAAAFGQRRKMLRRSLAGVVDRPDELLRAAGIEPTGRPEELHPRDFLRLAAILAPVAND